MRPVRTHRTALGSHRRALPWNGYLFGAAVSGNTLGGSIAVTTVRPGTPAWLTGGTLGPEASVFALLPVSSVTAGALVLRRRTPGRPRRRPAPTADPSHLATSRVG